MVHRVPNAQPEVDVKSPSLDKYSRTTQPRGFKKDNTFSRDVVSILSNNSKNKIYV